MDVLFLSLFVVFLLAGVTQCFFYGVFFLRIRKGGYCSPPSSPPPASIIICARNEARNLERFLPAVLEQDHPDFEVVVIDDWSDDDTPTILAELQKEHPHLRVVKRDATLHYRGKKAALTTGVREASHDAILVTDADCYPASPSWARAMTAPLNDGVKIVLGHAPYEKRPGWLNRLIRFETFYTALQYCSFALAGIPYMGVGRNMAFSRSLFLETTPYRNNASIASGDDDLFVGKAANKKNTRVVLKPSARTYSIPPVSFSEWSAQKRRHLSAAPRYRPFHKSLLGTLHLSTILFYATVLPLLFWAGPFPNVVWVIFLARVSLQIITFKLGNKYLDGRDLLTFTPLLEIVFLLSHSWFLFTPGRSNPDQWKKANTYPKRRNTTTSL